MLEFKISTQNYSDANEKKFIFSLRLTGFTEIGLSYRVFKGPTF